MTVEGEQAPSSLGRFGFRVADSYLAIAALLLFELAAVAVWARREMAGGYEFSRALLGLMPIAIAAAAPWAIAGAALVEAIRHADRLWVRLLVATAAAAFAATVAFGVSAGRHFTGGVRLPFVLGFAASCGLFAHVIGPPAARLLRPRPAIAWRLGLVLSVIAMEAAVEAANVIVLPRLYPAFHQALGALALLLAPAATLAVDATASADAKRQQGSPRHRSGANVTAAQVRAGLALLLFAASVAGSHAGAKRLSYADNIRLIYLDRAPLLSHAVELAAVLSPPPPIEDADLQDHSHPGQSIDLRDRDIVLITIDALRADHVSAYGYGRRTTPHIDVLAAEGVVFDHAYTPTPHTSYAVSSIMTGKYLRPLVLQGLGADSETWALQLRRYGYRTAAFYPPAVFFIDSDRFQSLRDRGLDFEYRKVEFATAAARVEQIDDYLRQLPPSGNRVFLWAHLFEPHEPYQSHADFPLGDRDIDRYDAEIAMADAGVGAIVRGVRALRPGAVVIVTADHGEEFREHGGRYHGTTVYEEQVRVPLVISAPGLLAHRRVAAPVQLIDLLPTVLSGLDIPRPARLRGNDLGPMLAGAPLDAEQAAGFAFAETDAHALLARGSLRLICARRIGACALYDLAKDPQQQQDLSSVRTSELGEMRTRLRAVEASHGRYEVAGLRREGKGWPEALRRGIAGDADAAADVAALLDDADVEIRRKAAEVLFELRAKDTAGAVRLALVRDEDEQVRRFCALALTRLGEGAPLAREIIRDADLRWRRLAALALAESGDDRGAELLIAWWREGYASDVAARDRKPIAFERAREIAEALGRLRSKAAVPVLLDALDDVRLTPHLARVLAAIGHASARPGLAKKLQTERDHIARVALAEALVKLGAGPELRAPLVRLLGTPDPLPDGLRIALDADLIDQVGGPRSRDLDRLRRFARSGVAVPLVVPNGGNGTAVRALCRARSLDASPGEVRIGRRSPRRAPRSSRDADSLIPSSAPELDAQAAVSLPVPPGQAPLEVFAQLPPAAAVRPGHQGEFVIYATQNVEVSACAVVPLSDELPPPPPDPWSPEPPQVEGERD